MLQVRKGHVMLYTVSACARMRLPLGAACHCMALHGPHHKATCLHGLSPHAAISCRAPLQPLPPSHLTLYHSSHIDDLVAPQDSSKLDNQISSFKFESSSRLATCVHVLLSFVAYRLLRSYWPACAVLLIVLGSSG